jgi:ParB-like nuclease domain
MSASVSYTQLAMFMKPHEIIDTHPVHPNEFEDDEYNWDEHKGTIPNTGAFWARKLDESETRSAGDTHFSELLKRGSKGTLASHIKTHGVMEPVEVDEDEGHILDGHHRLAAAAKYRPNDFIPVVHTS